MTSALKDICLHLDNVVSEFFVIAQDLADTQTEVNQLLSDGFILMAKARYSMGAKAVGQLQYDTNQMSRGARMNVKVEDGDFYPKNHSSYVQPPTGKSAGDTGIKKRHTTQDAGDANIIRGVQEIDLSSERSAEVEVQNNPLKWFGVLVPQSLKQCQGKFKRAAELSCKLASLKLKYSSLQQRFKDLKLEKYQLLNESLELSTDTT